MALDHNDAQILNGLFPFEQHEFNRGFVYISEQAVCTRLDQVDPSWHWDIKSVQVRDNAAVVVGTLTVKGVTREGVGMDKILETAGEAEKSAATDALKRAARLFGIGRYLLDNPKEGDFKKWLAAQHGAQKPAPIDPPRKAEPASAQTQWTAQQYDALLALADDNGVPRESLPGLLGVSRVSYYSPGFDKAAELVKAHGAAIKANGGAK